MINVIEFLKQLAVKTTYSNIRAKLNVNKLFVLILKFLFKIWLKGNDEEEELFFGSR